MVNKVEQKIKENNTMRQYHTPSCAYPRPKNAVFLSKANSKSHELAKAEVCYYLLERGHSFVTEAVRNKVDEKGKERRVDVVDLTDGVEYEIETTMARAKRFEGEKNVIVIELWKDKPIEDYIEG